MNDTACLTCLEFRKLRIKHDVGAITKSMAHIDTLMTSVMDEMSQSMNDKVQRVTVWNIAYLPNKTPKKVMNFLKSKRRKILTQARRGTHHLLSATISNELQDTSQFLEEGL